MVEPSWLEKSKQNGPIATYFLLIREIPYINPNLFFAPMHNLNQNQILRLSRPISATVSRINGKLDLSRFLDFSHHTHISNSGRSASLRSHLECKTSPYGW